MTTSNTTKSHWLQYADDKFSTKEISDIRAALDVIYLFIPFPFFWALFDQQVRVTYIIYHIYHIHKLFINLINQKSDYTLIS